MFKKYTATQDLTAMNNEEKLKYYLFPFQDQILDKKKMKDKNGQKKRLIIMNLSINITLKAGSYAID